MRSRIAVQWEKLRSSYWFTPSVMALSAVVLSIVTLALDRTQSLDPILRNSGLFWAGGPDGARELLAVIAGSMITVAGVTFSVTIVALQLASTQFGPRVLGSFMRNPVNQIVLGTFTATFLYCLLVLRTIYGQSNVQFVPNLSVTVGSALAVLSVGVLIYFIHHLAESIRAEDVVSAIGQDLLWSIDQVCPETACEDVQAPPPIPPGEEQACLVRARETGVVQSISLEELARHAARHGVTIRLLRRPGQFIAEGEPLARIWPAPEEDARARLERRIEVAYTIGRHRTLVQDLEYAAHQLADLAVRALSPSLNDPFTAVAAIERLEAGLARLLRRPMPSGIIAVEDRVVVVVQPWTFSDVASTTLDRLREYGRSHPIVLGRVLSLIEAIAEQAMRSDDLRVLERQVERVRDAAQQGSLIPADMQMVEERSDAALRALHLARGRLAARRALASRKEEAGVREGPPGLALQGAT